MREGRRADPLHGSRERRPCLAPWTTSGTCRRWRARLHAELMFGTTGDRLIGSWPQAGESPRQRTLSLWPRKDRVGASSGRECTSAAVSGGVICTPWSASGRRFPAAAAADGHDLTGFWAASSPMSGTASCGHVGTRCPSRPSPAASTRLTNRPSPGGRDPAHAELPTHGRESHDHSAMTHGGGPEGRVSGQPSHSAATGGRHRQRAGSTWVTASPRSVKPRRPPSPSLMIPATTPPCTSTNTAARCWSTRWQDYGPVAKTVETGVMLHMGSSIRLAAPARHAARLPDDSGKPVSGLSICGSRRPSGRLAAPPLPAQLPPRGGAIAVLVVLWICFPLVGASMAAIWLLTVSSSRRTAVAQAFRPQGQARSCTRGAPCRGLSSSAFPHVIIPSPGGMLLPGAHQHRSDETTTSTSSCWPCPGALFIAKRVGLQVSASPAEQQAEQKCADGGLLEGAGQHPPSKPSAGCGRHR